MVKWKPEPSIAVDVFFLLCIMNCCFHSCHCCRLARYNDIIIISAGGCPRRRSPSALRSSRKLRSCRWAALPTSLSVDTSDLHGVLWFLTEWKVAWDLRSYSLFLNKALRQVRQLQPHHADTLQRTALCVAQTPADRESSLRQSFPHHDLQSTTVANAIFRIMLRNAVGTAIPDCLILRPSETSAAHHK